MSLAYLQLAWAPCTAAILGATGALCDLRTRRIPNQLTGWAIVLGLALHGITGGWAGLGSSACSMLLCGGLFLIFYVAGGMGAGDVKMIAAEGALLGLSHAAMLLALTAICGGIMALVVVLARGRLRETFHNVAALLMHHSHRGLTPHPELHVLNASTLKLPYGLAIAAGAIGTVCLAGSGVVS